MTKNKNDVRSNWLKLFRQIHKEQRGAVSIETILIIAAVALPILIFILKFGWPKIRDFFNKGMNDLDSGVQNVTTNSN